AAAVFVALARPQDRLLADHSRSFHLLRPPGTVNDAPVAREQLQRVLAPVLDLHVVGPDEVSFFRFGLIVEILRPDGHRHRACRFLVHGFGKVLPVRSELAKRPRGANEDRTLILCRCGRTLNLVEAVRLTTLPRRVRARCRSRDPERLPGRRTVGGDRRLCRDVGAPPPPVADGWWSPDGRRGSWHHRDCWRCG